MSNISFSFGRVLLTMSLLVQANIAPIYDNLKHFPICNTNHSINFSSFSSLSYSSSSPSFSSTFLLSSCVFSDKSLSLSTFPQLAFLSCTCFSFNSSACHSYFYTNPFSWTRHHIITSVHTHPAYVRLITSFFYFLPKFP